MLNLVVQNGIKAIKHVQDKVKNNVEHFLRSTVAAEKLEAPQQQMRPGSTYVKLKNDVITRWNSTYDMFRRMSEIREPVEAALAVLGRPVESLTADEWKTLYEACTILKPYQTVTKEVSSEQSVTVSKVIRLVHGLKCACIKVGGNATTPDAQQLITTVSAELSKRFVNIEMNLTFAQATFLDARFKKLGFSSDTVFNAVRDKVQFAVPNAIANNSNGEQQPNLTPGVVETGTSITDDSDLIWDDFDAHVSSVIHTPQSSAIIKTRQNVEEPHIGRLEDPLHGVGPALMYTRVYHKWLENNCAWLLPGS